MNDTSRVRFCCAIERERLLKRFGVEKKRRREKERGEDDDDGGCSSGSLRETKREE